MRSQPQLYEVMGPVLARISEAKGGLEPLAEMLASDPPWRRLFFASFLNGVTDARTPMNLLLLLQSRGVSPTGEELQFYLKFLMRIKLYEVAYYTWSQFLPPDALATMGLLFNGKFDQPLSGAPFDWNIVPMEGARIDVVSQDEHSERKALALEFIGSSVGDGGVEQIVTLVPGPYRFRGLTHGTVRARRGLRVRVSCLDGAYGSFIGESALIASPMAAWSEFTFDFAVPTQNCRAQKVSVMLDARTDSEKLVTGAVYFSDFAIQARAK